jgi:predicted CoA-binding protein
MKTLASIKEFLAQKHMAVAGISRKKSKFGNAIFKELQKKNYQLYPLHPELEEYEGIACYAEISTLPDEVSGIVICTKPEKAEQLVNEAVRKGIKHIWLQQGAQNENTMKLADEHDINLITKECVLMFAEPSAFIHRFHRGINKFLGMYPK